MTRAISTSTATLPRQALKPLLVAAAAVALILPIAGPAAKAEASPSNGINHFCKQAWLAPYGQSGDRCFAGHDLWGHIYNVTLETSQRAGCVNYAGWYYELYTSWVCTGNNSATSIYVPSDGGSYQGVIRNNNLNYGGNFSGREYCCYFYG